MPNVVFCVLMALVKDGGIANIYQLVAGSGYEHSYVWTIMSGLRERCWVYKPTWHSYGITERGKIALAIEVGIRARAAARGNHRKRVSVKGYVTEKRALQWWR
jgi:hypothetical protein